MGPIAQPTAAPVAATAAKPGPTPAQAKAATQFEAVFLEQMMQLMLGSVQPDEFSGSHGEEMFRGVLAEKIGTEVAKHGGIGLSPAVLAQIVKMQEGNDSGR